MTAEERAAWRAERAETEALVRRLRSFVERGRAALEARGIDPDTGERKAS